MNSIDLTNCDREKIHLISYVQGHAAFVAVSPLDMKIHHASVNFPAFFQREDDVHFFIGKKLSEILRKDLVSLIQSRLREGIQGPERLLGSDDYDIFLFELRPGVFGVEFERSEGNEILISPENILNSYIQKIQDLQTLNELSLEACRAVRSLTGMERVMLYRFFPPTMYGEVIAEDKNAEAHSFMRHRFPPTDIPLPARDLYLRNRVRYIHDSFDKNAEILPKFWGKDQKVLDLSDSRIRGVSSVHLEYLKNMGVRSSLSFAVIVDQKLWGLIACHSKDPITVSAHTRALCETITNAFAFGARAFEKMNAQRDELVFFSRFHGLADLLRLSTDPLEKLFRNGDKVLELFGASGMILSSPGKTDFFGLTPLMEDIHELRTKILIQLTKEEKLFYVTDNLTRLDPDFVRFKEQASGIMAFRFSEVSDSLFMVLRPEYLETILWGGDPRKNIDARNYGGIINPRTSFDTWSEVVSETSRPWRNYEAKGIESFSHYLFHSLIFKEDLIQELQGKMKGSS